MEPIHHNLVFFFVLLVVMGGLADLVKPQWKLRRREIKRLRKEKRKKGEQASSDKDSTATAPEVTGSTGIYRHGNCKRFASVAGSVRL